jgi:hypothetical protein
MKNHKEESNAEPGIPPEYEKILADPDKTAGLIAENMRQIEFLEKARARILGVEVFEEKKIRQTPAGKVWDEQDKNTITGEISRFDPKLAEMIRGQKNKRKIVKTIDKRVKAIRKQNKKFEDGLEGLKERNIETMGKGGALAREILEEMAVIAKLSKEGAGIFDKNRSIRDEIRKTVESRAVGAENIGKIITLFRSMDSNTRKYLEIRKKVDEKADKLERLKQRATKIEQEFVRETEEIKRRRKAA